MRARRTAVRRPSAPDRKGERPAYDPRIDGEAIDGSGTRRDRRLIRLQASFACFAFTEHATWLAVLVYAFGRGGAREVGLVAALLLVPGVLVAPFAAYAGDRFPPRRALAAGYAAQSVSMAATAASMTIGWWPGAYVAGGVASTCVMFTRPVLGSLLPRITHAPRQLVVANGVLGLIEQSGVFVGPLVAGALMALSAPEAVFVTGALATAAAAALTVRMPAADLLGVPPGASAVLRQVAAGFATLRRHPRVRTLVLLGAVGGLANGVAGVVFVTFSDVRLGGGGGASGVLAGAFGLGAVAGAAVVLRIVGTGSVSCLFLAAAAAGSAGLVTLAVTSSLAVALVAFAAVGLGSTTVQITSSVTVQREAPGEVLARVFGILESVRMAAVMLGSFAVTVLVTVFGLATALELLAVASLLMAVGLVWQMRRLGGDLPPADHGVVLRLLRDPVLAPLPAPVIDRLARNATPITVDEGRHVVRQGEIGDRYYLVVDGALDVAVGGRFARTMTAGSSFGEVALLRDVPRTATVTATERSWLLAIERGDFLDAVTGHPYSAAFAAEAVARHLGSDGAG